MYAIRSYYVEREILVLVHPDRLRAYGLSITELAALVGGENVTIPAGRVTEPDAEFSVRIVGEYMSIADVQNLPLQLPQGGRIRLSDVATVREGFADVRRITSYNVCYTKLLRWRCEATGR